MPAHPVKIALAASVVVLPALLIMTSGTDVRAQDGPGVTISVSQGLEYIDREGFTDPTDEGLRSLTELGLTVRAANRSQVFEAQVDTGLSYNLSDSAVGFEVEDPFFQLNYILENRNSLYSFSSTYRETDLDDAVFFDDDQNDFIVSDGGERQVLTLANGLVLGSGTPVTLSFNHRYSRSRYTDTTNPALNDTTRNTFNLRSSLQVNPTTTVDVFASLVDRDEDGLGAEDRQDRSFGVGVATILTKRTRLSGEISYNEIETTSALGVTNSDGLGLSFGAVHEVPNGTYSFDISSRETAQNRTRYQVQLGRSLALSKLSTASFSLGATKTDGLSLQPLVSAQLNYEISPRSQLAVNLSQTATANNDDDETVRTQLGVNYTRELTSLSSLTAGIQFANSNVLSGIAPDQSSLRIDFGYRHDVGDDWALVSGYSYSSSRSDARDDRNTSRIFVSLEKNFNFRP